MRQVLLQTVKEWRVFVELFSSLGYAMIAIVATAVFVALPILVPVWLVPSNTIPLVLSLMSPVTYVLLALLTFASGTLISLNVFLLRQRGSSLFAVGETGIGSIASLFGGLVGTTCGCGISFVFGFLGLGIGGASFLIVNQLPILVGSLVVVLVSLYLAARKAGTSAQAMCAVVPIIH